jgi:hypothetical protein
VASLVVPLPETALIVIILAGSFREFLDPRTDMNSDEHSTRRQSQAPKSHAPQNNSAMHETEYSQANENLCFSFTMELAYFRFHVNSTVLLVVAYWFTAEVAILRYLISILGIVISVSGLVVEYRTIRYYRRFFDAIVSIETANGLTQMSFLTKHVTAPPLNLRTSHMIYALFTIGLAFWVAIFISDVFGFPWFSEMLIGLRDTKHSLMH